MRLRWPENPKVVEEGDPLDLSLVLENDGAEPAEFSDAFLVLFGRLLDEGGHEIATAGFRLLRALPLIRYRFDPGHTEAVSVALTLSPDDQRRLPPGRYTVVIPLGDARDEHTNSVLASSGASAPPPLTIEVRAHWMCRYRDFDELEKCAVSLTWGIQRGLAAESFEQLVARPGISEWVSVGERRQSVAVADGDEKDLYPTTIVLSRYGGIYEPGRWLAFPLYPEQLPKGYDGDDIQCNRFFRDYDRAVGGGESPDAAYDDLRRQIRQGRHP